MSMKSLGCVLVLAAWGFAGPLMAKQEWTFSADTPAAFEEQVEKVHEEMKGEGRYGDISAKDRTAVEADLNRIRDLLGRKGSAGALNDTDQVDLVNAQERVNAILTRNDGDRLVCTYERRSGSNFKYKNCVTVRDRDTARRKSQEGYQNELMRGGGAQQRGN